ncbi:MAG: hypothetical protein ABIT38_11795 [Gemmatimonadaceae bacterium]
MRGVRETTDSRVERELSLSVLVVGCEGGAGVAATTTDGCGAHAATPNSGKLILIESAMQAAY